jgi:hypothetical protein
MSVTVQSVVNQNGHAVITFADHIGGRYTETLFVPAQWTPAQLDAYAAAQAVALEGALADAEAERVIS